MRCLLLILLVAAPGLAAAQGACRGPQSCETGQVWDPALGLCTDQLIG